MRVDESIFRLGVIDHVAKSDAHVANTDVLQLYVSDAHGLHVTAAAT